MLYFASPTLLKFDYKYLTIGSIEPGCKRGGHYHKKTFEQFLCIDGRIAYFRDDDKTILEPGDIIDIPIGTVHTFINEGEGTAHFIEFKSLEVKSGEEDVYRKGN